MSKTRREFLKSCCGLGAAGVSAHLSRLGLVSANAQATSSYRALVCVFLFGGNDSNNMIVPIDSRYAAYQAMRPSVAIPQGSLLPAGSSGYGFHPALTSIQRLYNQQRVAMVFNVGTLFRPTTKAQLNTTPLPRNLYSHSDQIQQWQTSDPNGGSTGWGGRVNDLIYNQNTGVLPPGVSVNGGNALFLSGVNTKGLNYSNISSFGLRTFGDSAAMNARLASLQRILTFDTGLQMIASANSVIGESIQSAREVNAALASAPPLPVTFPNTSLGNQLAQVARLISVRGALGMNRQIFFAGLGGFDNHEELLPRHQALLAQVDGAINAFVATMEATGMMNQVTLFTESEFNRTGNANSNIGTDHGWGGHHLVIGGAVRGGTYGVFPTLALRGPDDAGTRGNWIPTTSLDQYGATLGSWFGVSDADLRNVFPNLVNFTPQKLSFL
ncbi:MAG: DUF1501 domain-containing protein [Bryobacteraceae bacterium]|nr:DUF1501 domain-containing protein [Bryobacteraceae bacterium]MDW8376979.1 DUF1501 domain-containing protein [Bryobacterales bacterium]